MNFLLADVDYFLIHQFFGRNYVTCTKAKENFIDLDEIDRLLLLFPEYCLGVGFADYLAQMLGNPHAIVRSTALSMLESRIFTKLNASEMKQLLVDFFVKHRETIVKVCLDKNQQLGLEILSKIQLILPDVISDHEIKKVMMLPLPEKLKKTAANLCNDHLLNVSRNVAKHDESSDAITYLDISDNEAWKIVTSEPFNKANVAYLKVVWAFVSSDDTICRSFFDTLGVSAQQLRDWPSFCHLLLDSKNGRHGSLFTEDLLKILLKSAEMVCCRNAAAYSSSDGIDWYGEWQRMSDQLLTALPSLLGHFMPDVVVPDAVLAFSPDELEQFDERLAVLSRNFCHLLKILRLVSLDTCSMDGQRFADILLKLRDGLDSSGSQQMLESIGKTFQFFENTDFSGSIDASNFFWAIISSYYKDITSWVNQLQHPQLGYRTKYQHHSLLRAAFAPGPTEMALLCFKIASKVNKLVVLFEDFDLTCLRLEQYCLAVLQIVSEKRIQNHNSAKQVFDTCLRYIVNSLSCISNKLGVVSEEESLEYQLSCYMNQTLKHLTAVLRQTELYYLFDVARKTLHQLEETYPSYASTFERDNSRHRDSTLTHKLNRTF